MYKIPPKIFLIPRWLERKLSSQGLPLKSILDIELLTENISKEDFTLLTLLNTPTTDSKDYASVLTSTWWFANDKCSISHSSVEMLKRKILKYIGSPTEELPASAIINLLLGVSVTEQNVNYKFEIEKIQHGDYRRGSAIHITGYDNIYGVVFKRQNESDKTDIKGCLRRAIAVLREDYALSELVSTPMFQDYVNRL